ncbi:hypothetical protein [Synechococcus sp. CS-1332]|uniref:hypothetical protein n=1 Tax=Synechococcus sp. CS-1332 TaxID=2847972 RepID=UPI00223AD003|nr:hypothetical protein [Synechococcus sp. CS-1332]MCT0207736.1 hypothetical protein [Synechococcus sp. CS-1332]
MSTTSRNELELQRQLWRVKNRVLYLQGIWNDQECYEDGEGLSAYEEIRLSSLIDDAEAEEARLEEQLNRLEAGINDEER